MKALIKSFRCDETLELDEVIALSRDHRGRLNPDELLNGFIPVWAIVIYTIAGSTLFKPSAGLFVYF